MISRTLLTWRSAGWFANSADVEALSWPVPPPHTNIRKTRILNLNPAGISSRHGRRCWLCPFQPTNFQFVRHVYVARNRKELWQQRPCCSTTWTGCDPTCPGPAIVEFRQWIVAETIKKTCVLSRSYSKA